ncbi:hypothetical protein [Enterovibrio norvegicus]|uniref:hypothetical protein n=1 Tax=Enterovibrio norvegicus TaxID=188144 RepID=UPI0039AF503F
MGIPADKIVRIGDKEGGKKSLNLITSGRDVTQVLVVHVLKSSTITVSTSGAVIPGTPEEDG